MYHARIVQFRDHFALLGLCMAVVFASTAGERPSASAFASAEKSFSGTPRWVMLAGSAPPVLRQTQRLQAVPTGTQVGFTVTLRVRNQVALNRFLAGVYNPVSPSYRHFLTTAEFVRQFAPAVATRAHTANWLKSQGLRVLGTSSNGLLLSVRGNVSALQHAFAPSLYTFRQNGRRFMANTRSLRLPAALASDVLAVSGLNTAEWQHPAALHPHQTAAPRGYAPADLAHLYGLDSLRTQGIEGTGQTVAIASFADYSASDLAVFDQQFNLSGDITRIGVSDGRATGGLLGAQNGQGETEADIEVVQGVAPRAAILLYEAPNSNQAAVALYNRIVSDNRAQVVTTSWGDTESFFSAADLSAIHQALQEGAAQGQTFFAASGDSGAFDGAGSGPTSSTTPAVDYPASDPWVTGVGGTTLTASGSQYLAETAWSDGSDPSTPVGSGGGLSLAFSRPSYQTGPGVSNQYSNGMRQVPDVAANADPRTGYAVYTVNAHDTPSWSVGGGTSAASPLWGGFAALVNQALGRRVGFLNPLLYQLGQRASTFSVGPYHDVVQGSNLYYPATVGWDFATGWGSFNGAPFVSALKTLSIPAPAAPPLPTVAATATATATATPEPAQPTVTIQQVVLLHSVKGRLQMTDTLKVGEKGTIVVLYQTTHASSLLTSGTIVVRESGHVLQTIVLKATRYNGKPALMAALHFTSKKHVGTLLAHVMVSLGLVSSALNHVFTLAPLK